jgi:hypothetical protein
MTTQIRADRSQPALVHGARLAWIASPEPGVERRMLERAGGEVAIASTIVRYAPQSNFHSHPHGLGEEFIVLDGIFSDEDGDYPPGTYVRNPPGSKHAPFSRDGCIIFVKLRQMQSDEGERVRVYEKDRQWTEVIEGYARALLYSNGRTGVWLERSKPGVHVPPRSVPRGEELFVLSGMLRLLDSDRPVLEPWSWLRHPGDRHPELVSDTGAMWWVKRGHLA